MSSDSFQPFLQKLFTQKQSVFNSFISSLQPHVTLFIKLSLSPHSILNTITENLTKYQPSMKCKSYHPHSLHRFRLFLLLACLCNNPSLIQSQENITDDQLQKIIQFSEEMRKLVGVKLRNLICMHVFPCNAAFLSERNRVHSICKHWSKHNLFKKYILQNIVKDLQSLFIIKSTFNEPPNLLQFINNKKTKIDILSPMLSSIVGTNVRYSYNYENTKNVQIYDYSQVINS